MKLFLRCIKIFVCLFLCTLSGLKYTAHDFSNKPEKTEINAVISEVEPITEETVSEVTAVSEEEVTFSEPVLESEPQSAVSSQSVSVVEQPKTEAPKPKPTVTVSSNSSEMRAVWISFLEYQKILKGKTEGEFKNAVCEYFDNCAEYGLNTVIVQARSHGDAYYKSAYFPASVNFTVIRQNSFPFDPLKIMVEEAHKRRLKIEAWVNPYRGNNTADGFAPDDPIAKWLGTEKVFKWGDPEKKSEYYFFNPGEPEVRQLIINGIIELVENYDIDGIHFDDYFYPTQDSSIDSATYQNYGAGRMLKEFRTDCVNELISAVYREIKARKNITFGISPAGNIDNCLNKSCADVKLWGSTTGYVDYLAPQLYWDYGQGSLPFETALENWKKAVSNADIKLIVGLAAYRVTDTVSEFWSSGDVLKRQVEDSRVITNYGGFAMFRYDFFFSDRLKTERGNLKQILG